LDWFKRSADFHRNEYLKYIGEATGPFSNLKSPYYLPSGFPDGIYRVGPLARLDVIPMMGTHQADQELVEFRDRNHLSSFNFHLLIGKIRDIIACG
jgi:NAD-reducing hydrogenase large subunit